MDKTGRASKLLNLQNKFHSRLKAPLYPTEKSILNITKQSTLSKLVQKAKLLLIDEVTLLHKFQIEASEKTLQDLNGNDNYPFGWKNYPTCW